MRILVIGNLPPYVLGGAENQVARLVEAWIRLGHHVEVAGQRLENGRVQLGSVEARIHRIRITDRAGRAGRAATYFLSLAPLLRRLAPHFDVVYTRGFNDAAICISVLKHWRLLNVPLVAVPINAKGAGDAAFIRSIPGWRSLVPLLNRHTNAINIIAPAIEPDLVELGITLPVLSRIPNGIPIQPRVQRGAPGAVRKLAWTGRLSRQKGLDVLLHALAAARAGGREFVLELIGTGPEEENLRKLTAELGLGACVRFAGRVPVSEVRAHLAAADAFVFPSRYEGMSNSVLEAMEAGLPVVLTHCGGIDTYVDARTGWTCDPEDVPALVGAVNAMLDTPAAELLAMGQRARDLVEAEFEIESIARRNVDVLARAAATHGPRRR
ncbi:MAG: glycosyltransferase family 4 protein [Gammaproteobacteria bacterium]|nr:glycosyltransferase family 4 protein [Gammaproteobacteria bacterium]